MSLNRIWYIKKATAINYFKGIRIFIYKYIYIPFMKPINKKENLWNTGNKKMTPAQEKWKASVMLALSIGISIYFVSMLSTMIQILIYSGLSFLLGIVFHKEFLSKWVKR